MVNLTESRYPGKCIICDESFSIGEAIYYEGNQAWHMRHGKTPSPPKDLLEGNNPATLQDAVDAIRTGVQADFAELKALVRMLIEQGKK
jgi:hypothetical protein